MVFLPVPKVDVPCPGVSRRNLLSFIMAANLSVEDVVRDLFDIEISDEEEGEKASNEVDEQSDIKEKLEKCLSVYEGGECFNETFF